MAEFGDLLSLDLENDDPDSQGSLSDVMNEILDEVTLGLCFEIHRSCKLGTVFLDDTDTESRKQYEIVNEKGVDVFGQVPMKKQYECICPNCHRNLAASRFAPHLEKCMGMGRNSSRIASRRLADAGKKEATVESDDNDNDQDWSYAVDKKVKKLKKERSNHSPRRGKSSKIKNGDIPSVSSTGSDGSNSQNTQCESMSLEEKKSLLLQTCGVISEHTKKMCTRSARCPQHTGEQRRALRLHLLGQQGSGEPDDVHVDIDTYDDAENQVLRDTLQWEALSNPSPADSNSTTSSTSKKRRGGSKHGKKKSSKTSNNASAGTPSNMYEFV